MLIYKDEETLQKWEANPVRYRRQIESYDKQITEHFRTVIMKMKYPPSSDTENFKRVHQEHLNFYRLMTRVTNMCTAIIKHDCEQWESGKRSFSKPETKPRRKARRVVISNDANVLCAAADQYQWELWIKKHPILGSA